MAQLPDTELVNRARNGDSGATEAVLRLVQPILRSFFIGRIGKGPDVDDLVQNTLLRLHRGLPDLNDPSSLKSFAMKAAIFELQDFYRGRYSLKEHLFDPDAPPTEGYVPATEAEAFDVDRIMAALTPHARRILELRAYGYKYDEIGEMVGSSEAAIKMQVKRALDKLRTLFALLVGFGMAAWKVSV